MLQGNYNPEQVNAYGVVEGLVNQLVEIEELQGRAHKLPVLGVSGALDQATADIRLDCLPPYAVLEERLRTAITEARDLGLDKDPFILEFEARAFS